MRATHRYLAATFLGLAAILTLGCDDSTGLPALPSGKHLVRLDGLAANCSVNGVNPRSVDVSRDNAASRVSFSVSCFAKDDSGAGAWDY